MKTGETVIDLGLYESDCCSEEMVFDIGDTFFRCPKCNHLCVWDLEEEIVPADEFQHTDGVAA